MVIMILGVLAATLKAIEGAMRSTISIIRRKHT
ncbi:MAG: hypothetical protein ACI84K_002067 [Pseudohongiellaceae bacterium]|jgi:hypothetical protein